MTETAQLFLIWHGAEDAEVQLAEPSHPLTGQMFMVRSERSRSKVYHAVKWQLPPDTPLCVAPLAADPKFKGMADGALKWLRAGEAGP